MDLNDPKAKAELLAVMKEISHEMHKLEVGRDQIKEIIDAAASTFDIEKPLLRKVARFYHKRSIAEFQTEAGYIKEIYDGIVNVPTNP